MDKGILFFIAIIVFSISCQKELNFNTEDNSSGLTCIECEYMPICDSSKFSFIDSTGSGSSVQRDIVYDVASDTTVSGVIFKKILESGSNTSIYLSCINNTLLNFTPTPTGIGGVILNNITRTPLKANEAVNGVWQDEVLATGFSVQVRYKIIEKGSTRQVLDSTYRDVIYVRDTTVLIMPLLGELPAFVQKVYYAKGIGPIETINEQIDPLFGTTSLILHRKLKSYRIR